MSDAALFYTGLVAEAYAALKAETFDPQRYADFVERAGQPALEVGCGDGHPLLELRDRGLDVDGVDSSEDMISRAREASAARGHTPMLVVDRMEGMRLDRRYRAIYLAGPTFELLPDDDTALAALRSFRAHLEEDGTIMVPLWLPSPTPPEDLGRSREAEDAAGTTLRYTPLSESFDTDGRTRRTQVRYERIAADAETAVVEQDWIIHAQTPATMRQLAGQADLRVTDVSPPERTLTGEPGEECVLELCPA